MRFETISTTDLCKYALIGLRQVQTDDPEELYLLEEQIDEIEDALEGLSKDRPTEGMKRLKIGAKFGDWYYMKWEDETGYASYNLYDSSGEYINEFWGLGDMKKYIYKLFSAKRRTEQ